MPQQKPVGCARPTGGVVGEEPPAAPSDGATPQPPKERRMVQVGRKAPDFVAPCYYEGKFGQVSLSEYLGKWVVLCFYPGDFTFV